MKVFPYLEITIYVFKKRTRAHTQQIKHSMTGAC